VTANHIISATFEGGWTAPTNNSNSSFNSGVGNAYASDNTYAVATGDNQGARYYGFGFSIPAGNVIDGIQVSLEGNRTGTRSFVVDLTWNNNNFSTAITQPTSFTASDSTILLGSSSTTAVWGGHTWTPAEINNNNFRVRVASANFGGGNISLDQVQVKVYHHTPGPHTIIATANSGGTINPSGSVIVAEGATQAFVIAPSANYIVTGVSVDSSSVGSVNNFTFTNTIADHTIEATFGDGWSEPAAYSDPDADLYVQ
jgi:hypothetical protein